MNVSLVLREADQFSPSPQVPEGQAAQVSDTDGQPLTASSLLKKQPGEGTGPTMHADCRENLVGRVPSRGEHKVLEEIGRA